MAFKKKQPPKLSYADKKDIEERLAREEAKKKHMKFMCVFKRCESDVEYEERGMFIDEDEAKQHFASMLECLNSMPSGKRWETACIVHLNPKNEEQEIERCEE